MNDEKFSSAKKNIIAIGALLWEKDLVSGLNGNISVRVENDQILLTATKTCLGLLQPKDILLVNTNGEVLEHGMVSTEKMLHTEIYKSFPEIHAVVHTHTSFANAYFLAQPVFQPEIIETKLFLGTIQAVEQFSPSVTDSGPVIEALKANNLVALRKHGLVAAGKDLFDCFLLIQSLEEAIKVDAIKRLYVSASKPQDGCLPPVNKVLDRQVPGQAYKMFSREHMDEIVRRVNADEALKRMGRETRMTMELAVKLNETGEVFSFHFEDGTIASCGDNEQSEFLISAPEAVWRAVFNREIDPFVATTQKKMNLRGDFARISRWYAPCSRIFQLWQQVPIE